LDLQVAEIKDLKAVYSLMYYVALFRAWLYATRKPYLSKIDC
jgi:hypothetical protein